MAAFKISFHSGSGQYVKYIGKKDGKPKAWYLGINADDALSKALALKKRWEAITANGGCDWNDEAKEIGNGQMNVNCGLLPAVFAESSNRLR